VGQPPPFFQILTRAKNLFSHFHPPEGCISLTLPFSPLFAHKRGEGEINFPPKRFLITTPYKLLPWKKWFKGKNRSISASLFSSPQPPLS